MGNGAALGVDLGTTFSVVAQINEMGLPVVLPNSEGSPTTPSVVLFDGDVAVVGAVARESLASEPESVVQLVKRHMGSQWTFDYQGHSFRPEHVSSLILRKVVRDAQLLVGDVAEVAITVPAYFNDSMRLATRRAGEMAGLDVLGLLSEPTAAALAFGYQQRATGTTGVVIDLGGGTFDVTVMRFNGHDLDVLATGGDAYLGGANFDKALFDHFVEEFEATHGLNVNDPDALTLEEYTQVSQDWLGRANRAKHDLTSRDRTMVALQAAGVTKRLEVQRETFQSLTRILVDEMTEKMVDVVAAAGLQPADVDVILAVGGSTRLPAVRDSIVSTFGHAPDTTVRPDEAVALGCALFAAQRQLERGESLVMDERASEYLRRVTVNDVASHSLGVSVFDRSADIGGRRVMVPILARNLPLPLVERKSFFTMKENETRIVIPILEGEDPDPDLCRRIGEVVVEGLPPGRPPRQEIVVTMRLDRDGILEVAAKDVSSAAEVVTTIVHTNDSSAEDDDEIIGFLRHFTVE